MFKTFREADTFATQARIARKNEGRDAFSLPVDVRTDAAKASAKLKPHGVSLLEAANYYLKHVVAFREAPTVEVIIKKLLAETEAAGRREKTLVDLQYRLGRFARSFAGRKLADITLPELQEWLADPSLSARSRINFSVKVSQLYRYAIRHAWTETNLVERITRPDPEDGEPGILTVDQCASLLEQAEKFDLLPYVALGLFAGLRSAELMRLQWPAVKLVDRAVIVGSEVAKKRSRRVVEISDTLAEWLAPYSKLTGNVTNPENFRKRMFALRREAGIKEWPANCLRHSFGSYHLAMFGDAVRTAAQMGHRDVGVLHVSYKALVTRNEAERYWKLRPPAQATNVLAFRTMA